MGFIGKATGGLTRDIDGAVARDADGSRAIIGGAAKALRPLLNAGGIVFDHDAVISAQLGGGSQRTADRTGDDHIAVAVHRDGRAIRLAGRAQRARPDQLSGGVVLLQNEVGITLDQLPVDGGRGLADCVNCAIG